MSKHMTWTVPPSVCCGEKKAGGPIGTNLLGIPVLLSCGVCETRNVQNGNCFGLFGTRALRALWILDFVDIGFSHTLSAVVLVPEELASPLEGVWCRQNSFCCSTLGWPVALRSGP